jgi:hypothetical protein
MDPRAGLEDVEKRKFLTPLGLELRPLGRPAPSQSLYRHRYSKKTREHNISETGSVSVLRVDVSP